MTAKSLSAQVLQPGEAAGTALVLSEPLSFWGGFDPASGRVIDKRHPQTGAETAGKILLLPESHGSGGTPAGLAEAIRRGTAPAAIVLARADVNITIGAMIANELYGRVVPVLVITEEDFGFVREGDHIAISRDGKMTVGRD